MAVKNIIAKIIIKKDSFVLAYNNERHGNMKKIHEKEIIAKNRGIKNYQNMSEKELLNAIVGSGRILKNLSQNGLMKIAKMENLSQKGLKKIEKMPDLSRNKLEQIAKLRHIKNIDNMSK